MTHLLVIRERLIRFHQNNARVIDALFRFLISFVTFFSVNQLVGYNPVLKPWYVIAALSIVNAVLPLSVLIFLAAVYAVLQIYYVSVVLALVLAVVFLIAYLVYLRFLPEHGYVILAVPILYGLHLPYIIPILLGILAAPAAILPMSCGIVCYYALQGVTSVIGTATEDSIELFHQVMQTIFSNQEMYWTIGIFAVVMVVVNLVCSHEFHYVYEISITVGALLNILLTLGIHVSFNIQIHVWSFLAETVLSAFLVWMIQFFRLVLNYSAVEYLQFEDDEYYYYVKAVPKISITVGEKRVKRFNAHLLGGGRFGGALEEGDRRGRSEKRETARKRTRKATDKKE